MIVVNLNADMHAVHSRLAEKENAGMAEVAMHLLRNEDYSGSTPDASPKVERERR